MSNNNDGSTRQVENVRDEKRFIVACLPSITDHIETAMRVEQGYNITNETVNKFFKTYSDKFLSSVGIAMDNARKKKSCKTVAQVIEDYVKDLDLMRSRPYYKNCEFNIDSAGYQVQEGYLGTMQEIDAFRDEYYKFVEANKDKLEYAFVLDLAPGRHCRLFDNAETMYLKNLESTTLAANLPEEARKKMIYVHHFRTPEIRQAYNKLLSHKDLFNAFDQYSTGGLVSSARKACPIVLYTIPLVDILKQCVEQGKKHFRFHVLGASEWKEILVHCFFEKLIEDHFGIKCELTYDSSSIHKLLMLGRYTYIANDEARSVMKLSVRSTQGVAIHNEDTAQLIGKGRHISRNYNIFFNEINKCAASCGMKPLDPQSEDLYWITERGTISFRPISYLYGVMQLMRVFKKVREWCVDDVERLYPLYKAGDLAAFNCELQMVLQRLNNEKHTKVISTRSDALSNSLDRLKTLDTAYFDEFVIPHYLS